MPRWVKVFVAVGIALVLGLIVSAIAGVEHGPRLHRPGESPPTESPSAP